MQVSDYIYRGFQFIAPTSIKELSVVALAATSAIYSPQLAGSLGVCYLGYKSVQWYKNPQLAESNHAVKTIYTPQIPKKIRDQLALYQEQIIQIKEAISLTAVQDAKDLEQYVPVYIKIFCKGSIDTFTMYNIKDDSQLGFATVYPFTEKTNFGEEHIPIYKINGVISQYEGYGPEINNKITKIYLELVKNMTAGSYKHVASTLFKVILQYYESCHFRVALESVNNAGSLWYKMGFRIRHEKDQQKQDLFAKEAENKVISQKNHGYCQMYLNDDARALWKKEIEENPIFLKKP